MKNLFIIGSLALLLIIGLMGWHLSHGWWFLYFILIPIIVLGLYDMIQTQNSIFRNFPVVGRFREVAGWMRPKIHQYFVESDTEGTPFNKLNRDIIKARSKKGLDTNPFGTQLNVYNNGYEWMNHSIAAKDFHSMNHDPRVLVGGKDCKKPYSLSVFNISAMSYGSLSSNAVLALNGGAAIGGFAHNTGEGGISPHHRKHGGDLIYQIGTGYFGCRDNDGNFSAENFKKTIADTNVKMIEVKLSQGAKPGHGGILPAKKVTEEIAKIRNIEMGKDVLSPPFHKAFSTPKELLYFLKELRDLSEGLPVGFKLCVGQKSEFLAICKAMMTTGIKPDFITVDGGEGGTGAAPLEFSNHVGTPYREGLSIVYDALIGFDIKKEIQLIASGKITTGFDIFRAFALGADACYSARGMMIALGCIQALECNSNTCPTGVATSDPALRHGLVVEDKKQKVANFHDDTVEAFVELLAAGGMEHQDQINRSHVYRRIHNDISKSYLELYPYIPEGSLLTTDEVPENWKSHLAIADPDSFLPKFESIYIEED